LTIMALYFECRINKNGDFAHWVITMISIDMNLVARSPLSCSVTAWQVSQPT